MPYSIKPTAHVVITCLFALLMSPMTHNIVHHVGGDGSGAEQESDNYMSYWLDAVRHQSQSAALLSVCLWLAAMPIHPIHRHVHRLPLHTQNSTDQLWLPPATAERHAMLQIAQHCCCLPHEPLPVFCTALVLVAAVRQWHAQAAQP